eukprot:1157298-Pelagomonas_calceolata.AAC.13
MEWDGGLHTLADQHAGQGTRPSVPDPVVAQRSKTISDTLKCKVHRIIEAGHHSNTDHIQFPSQKQ